MLQYAAEEPELEGLGLHRGRERGHEHQHQHIKDRKEGFQVTL